MKQFSRNIIVVEVLGGCVVNVFANGDASVLIVDHDNIEEGSRPEWMAVDPPETMTEDTQAIVEDKLPDLRDK